MVHWACTRCKSTLKYFSLLQLRNLLTDELFLLHHVRQPLLCHDKLRPKLVYYSVSISTNAQEYFLKINHEEVSNQ